MSLGVNKTASMCLPSLLAGEIHVWQRPLSPSAVQLAALYNILAEDEQQRAQRFRFDKHRMAFVTTRGTLRILLGHYLHMPPATVGFCYNTYGKPLLQGDYQPLHFNISHSAQWSIYAIAIDTELGVDLQKSRPAPPQERIDFARRFFSDAEFATLTRLPATQVNAAFFAGWTRKEATIKCHGSGLSQVLSQFSVSMDPEEIVHLVAIPWQSPGVSHYRLHDLPAPPGYHAALALAAIFKMTLRHFQWSE